MSVAPIVAATRALERRVAGLPFRDKLTALSRLAVAAVVLTFVLHVAAGLAADRAFSRVTNGYAPAVTLARDLQDLERMTRDRLADATASGDAARLATADTLVTMALGLVRDAHSNPVLDDDALDSLAHHVTTGFAASRAGAQGLIARRSTDGLADTLRLATREHAWLDSSLSTMRHDHSAHVAAAGRLAFWLRVGAWIVSLAVTTVVLVVLARLFRSVSDSVTGPIGDAAHAAQRIAAGELPDVATTTSDDEIGRLLAAMHEMSVHLREMGHAAATIADGDLRAVVTPRSEADIFGQAFRRMLDSLRAQAETATRIADGDLSVAVTPRSDADALGHAFVGMTAYLRDMAGAAERLAAGDLTVTVTPRSAHDQFGLAFGAMRDRLARTIAELRSGISATADASRYLAEAAQTLTAAAQEEAMRVEATSRALGDVESLIQKNVVASRAVEALAERASTDAATTGDAARESVASMQAIAQQVTVVGAIARQTTMLSLNAAVEAARAGDAGRGFEVVAEEVRRLSSESHAAARAIGERADASRTSAEHAGALLDALMEPMRESAVLAREVAGNCAAQTTSIQDAGQTMAALASTAERTREAVDRLAATAQELAAQSTVLADAISVFTVERTAHAKR